MLTAFPLRYFLTASYDGAIRVFDYSQKLLHTVSAHTAPVSSIAVVSSDTPDSHLIASASHDLTARLTRIDLSPAAGPSKAQTLASLHLHTAPLSSVATNASGSHILTSSWDGLIGLWDTSIPGTDEVPVEETVGGGDRKKRRKVADDGDAARPKRKAPTAVLKSHTARVSRVVFGRDRGAHAYSCGFDSTVRTWDVENGVCTGTIVRPPLRPSPYNLPGHMLIVLPQTASSKPFLDLALSQDGATALAASTDRTVCQYDLRASTSSATTPSVASLAHPATPSSITVPQPGSGSAQQLVTGAYDGVVRLWDLRSTKAAVAAFRAWEAGKAKDEGPKKVLSVDWARGMVGVGGEGGVEVWKVGEGERVSVAGGA